MPSTENQKIRQKAGRKEKPLPDNANPRTILAARLRELKSACGSPTYDELASLSGVYKTGLLEAASATRLPRWHVVKGYVEGCWKHYEIRFSEPFAHAGDTLQWQQLYRDAGGTMPDEFPLPTPGHDEQAKRRLVISHDDEPAEPASRPFLAGGLPPAGEPSAVPQFPAADERPVSLPPRLYLWPKWRWAALALALLCLIVLAWPASPTSRPGTSAPTTVAEVTAYNFDSAEEQFAVGSDCRIYHRWQKKAGGPFGQWTSMGGCASAPQELAVAMNGDGELVAFAISPDHAVMYKSQTRPALGPWTSWTSMGGDVSTGLRAVSAPSGSFPIRVYARDKSGNLWENNQPQGNCCWTGWRKIQPPSPSAS
jgi:hypothetical protein